MLSNSSLNRYLLYKTHYYGPRRKPDESLISRPYPPAGYCTRLHPSFFAEKISEKGWTAGCFFVHLCRVLREFKWDGAIH